MSGFYIGVDGKARKIKGGYIGVDGKARKIKKGYIGVNGVARLCWSDVDPVFENNSWEEIAVACQNGNIPDSWDVGDQKTMEIGGVNYAIDIIGKNHDDYADGSGKAPLTFQLHDCYNTRYNMNNSNSNSGGWRDSVMRNTHLPNIFNLMPSEVRNLIKEVVKRTGLGNSSSTINVTNDKLFLLSEPEVYGSATYSQLDEGTQYAYYVNGGSKIKHVSGTVNSWWERSPMRASAAGFCEVYSTSYTSTNYASNPNGVSFAFCF